MNDFTREKPALLHARLRSKYIAATLLFGSSVALLSASCALCAQDISGDWQGTITTRDQETGRYRYLLHVARESNGSFAGTLRAIDQRLDWDAAKPLRLLDLQGSHLQFSTSSPDRTYEGTVGSDGASITGAWIGQSRQLMFVRPTEGTTWRDSSPHSSQFVTVADGVQLEVLDWGGSGPPLVLLAGLGNSAHIFDGFAPRLTAANHVYGITRRGYGESSVPESGYTSDRLGDDVLEVIDLLKLNRPVLVGHSVAGQELSSIGSRAPARVSGLIYLDAGYSYAYYDSSIGDFGIDLRDVRRKLERLEAGMLPENARKVIQELLQDSLPAFERDLRTREKQLASVPPLPPGATPPLRPPFQDEAIMAGSQKYTHIPVPILAIFAVPHTPPAELRNNPTALAAFDAREEASVGKQAKAFETGLLSARVVRIPHADHYVFISNEADVIREVNAFLERPR